MHTYTPNSQHTPATLEAFTQFLVDFNGEVKDGDATKPAHFAFRWIRNRPKAKKGLMIFSVYALNEAGQLEGAEPLEIVMACDTTKADALKYAQELESGAKGFSLIARGKAWRTLMH